ncbi:MAG: energy transducer TonB family protein, partial [Planctomycetaceae bacterium]
RLPLARSEPYVPRMTTHWTRHCRALSLVLPLAGCGEAQAIEEPTPLTDLSAAFGYPIELWDEGFEGQTTLMVHVTALGDVDSSYVSASSGHEAFDSAAMAGIQDVRFTPARRGPDRVPMWIRLPVRFSRDRAAAREDS